MVRLTEQSLRTKPIALALGPKYYTCKVDNLSDYKFVTPKKKKYENFREMMHCPLRVHGSRAFRAV